MPSCLNLELLLDCLKCFINLKVILIYTFLGTFYILFDFDTFLIKFLKSNLLYWTVKKNFCQKQTSSQCILGRLLFTFSTVYATLPNSPKIKGWLRENRCTVRTLSALSWWLPSFSIHLVLLNSLARLFGRSTFR